MVIRPDVDDLRVEITNLNEEINGLEAEIEQLRGLLSQIHDCDKCAHCGSWGKCELKKQVAPAPNTQPGGPDDVPSHHEAAGGRDGKAGGDEGGGVKAYLTPTGAIEALGELSLRAQEKAGGDLCRHEGSEVQYDPISHIRVVRCPDCGMFYATKEGEQ